jgi:hypothetical protein
MKNHLALLACAAVISFGSNAASAPTTIVTARFFYATNPDSGISLEICPDKASRAKESFLKQNECIYARNVEKLSGDFEKMLRVASLKNVDYECGYHGSGTFSISAFKTRKEDQTEMGGDVFTVAEATVTGFNNLQMRKKDCDAP